MIEDIHASTGCGIRAICASLEVPRSSFYHAAVPTPTQWQDRRIGGLIEAIFARHRRRYGYRRIREELSDQGVVCAPDRIRRIMRERGLRAIQPKTYVPKTSDGRADKPSPNLLLAQPLPVKPDPVWAGDICQRPPALPFGQRLRPLAIAFHSVPSSPPPAAGFIWPSSSISAPAKSSAGPWPATCAPPWWSMLSNKPWDRAARSQT